MKAYSLCAVIALVSATSVMADQDPEHVFCEGLQAASKDGFIQVPVEKKSLTALYEQAGYGTESKMFAVLAGDLDPDQDLKDGINSYLADKCKPVSLK